LSGRRTLEYPRLHALDVVEVILGIGELLPELARLNLELLPLLSERVRRAFGRLDPPPRLVELALDTCDARLGGADALIGSIAVSLSLALLETRRFEASLEFVEPLKRGDLLAGGGLGARLELASLCVVRQHRSRETQSMATHLRLGGLGSSLGLLDGAP
jgi:hypothetical protein